MEPRVLGLIDHTHTTAAQPFQNAVMGDRLTDHVEGRQLRRILWRASSEVNTRTGIASATSHVDRGLKLIAPSLDYDYREGRKQHSWSAYATRAHQDGPTELERNKLIDLEVMAVALRRRHAVSRRPASSF